MILFLLLQYRFIKKLWHFRNNSHSELTDDFCDANSRYNKLTCILVLSSIVYLYCKINITCQADIVHLYHYLLTYLLILASSLSRKYLQKEAKMFASREDRIYYVQCCVKNKRASSRRQLKVNRLITTPREGVSNLRETMAVFAGKREERDRSWTGDRFERVSINARTGPGWNRANFQLELQIAFNPVLRRVGLVLENRRWRNEQCLDCSRVTIVDSRFCGIHRSTEIC